MIFGNYITTFTKLTNGNFTGSLMLTILITGKYDPAYNRNLVLFTGLKKRGDIRLIEHPIVNSKREEYQKIGELSKQADIIFMPAFTHLDVPKVKIFSDKPLFFDPLISRYMSKVFDYKTVWKYSPRAYKNFLKDKLAFQNSDFIFADTVGHKNYYIKKFKVPAEKIGILPVGVLKDLFFKMDLPNNEKFTVGFFGSFIPLHGVDKILQAAWILRGKIRIEFKLYGHGVGFSKMQKMAKRLNLTNLHFMGYLNFNDINSTINSFDLCLGIFGNSIKADIVIPNKIYQYAACGKAILTMDSRGIREIFTKDQNILLCDGTAEDLANNVLECYRHRKGLNSIGSKAMKKIREEYNEDKIAEMFVSHVHSLI